MFPTPSHYSHTENVTQVTAEDPDTGVPTAQSIIGSRDVSRDGRTLGPVRLYDRPLPAHLNRNGNML